MKQVVIVDNIRTGLAKAFRGTFNLTRADDMLAHCINALLARNPTLDPALVDDVIAGAARQTGEQSANIARHAVALSHLPVTASAMSLSRACASGLNAIAVAAQQIACGCGEVAIAGGVESISGLERGRSEFAENPRLLTELSQFLMPMGETAEIVATRYRIGRERQDAYALQSQQRYAAAVDAGYVSDEIAPMTVIWRREDRKDGTAEVLKGTVDRDECNRPGTTLDALTALAPVFREDGTVTAGNASQLSDGASMTLLMSETAAARLGIQPLAYFRGFAVAGCEPDEMGIGPVFAIPKLLKRHGLAMQDVDLVELNEAFASQCLYCRDALDIDNGLFNVNGGAIAIGHPYGMTGSRMTGVLLRELRRRSKKLGIVSMCVGKGMGAAALFEAC